MFGRKEGFDSKGLKVNLKKIEGMVSGTKAEILKSKVYSCAKSGESTVTSCLSLHPS